MDKGELVPDSVTINMLADEVDRSIAEAKGYIFDGFPRTTAQAEALDTLLSEKGMQVNATIALEADEDELTARLLERGKTSGRTDDTDETKIRTRFAEYNAKTAPLIEFYEKQNKLHSVNGIGEIDQITERIASIIASL
jgi:adenylate kinase